MATIELIDPGKVDPTWADKSGWGITVDKSDGITTATPYGNVGIRSKHMCFNASA